MIKQNEQMSDARILKIVHNHEVRGKKVAR